jgi:hypothetical protein
VQFSSLCVCVCVFVFLIFVFWLSIGIDSRLGEEMVHRIFLLGGWRLPSFWGYKNYFQDSKYFRLQYPHIYSWTSIHVNFLVQTHYTWRGRWQKYLQLVAFHGTEYHVYLGYIGLGIRGTQVKSSIQDIVDEVAPIKKAPLWGWGPIHSNVMSLH